MVYVSDDLLFKRRSDLELDSGELIWIEINFPNYNLLLCTVYRPENCIYPFWNNLQFSIESALAFSLYVVITGDLNVNLLLDRPKYTKRYYDDTKSHERNKITYSNIQ